MENAVKALIIAAGALLGVLILSLAVSLYTSLRGYVGSVQDNATSKEVQEFNEQFFKYINCETLAEEPQFTLTIQDVVTAANTAYENNIRYELTEYQNNNFYVRVTLDGNPIEGNINSRMAELLENELGQEYKCSRQDIEVDTVTGRVYEVNFHK